MNRRDLIALAGASLTLPPTARAQQPTKRPLVGFLSSGTRERDEFRYAAFLQGMRDLGRVAGQTFDIEARYADGRIERYPALAADLARTKPDVIVTSISGAVIELRKAAPATPIVAAVLTEPVRFGFVESIPRPGGLVTGIMSAIDGMSAKQFEIALDLVPGVTKVGLLANALNVGNPAQFDEIKSAAATRGVTTVLASIASAAEFRRAFDEFTAAGVQAIVVLRDPLATSAAPELAEAAARARLPTIFSFRESVDAGGLINYGVNIASSYRRAATFVDKILKGARPGDIPVEFPTRFEMVINMKTARALGLSIPPSLLVRADEVIE